MHLKKLPQKFFTDHAERGLPTPQVVRFDATHVWVRPNDPALPELKADAEHYAHPDGPDDQPPGLRASARATAAALA